MVFKIIVAQNHFARLELVGLACSQRFSTGSKGASHDAVASLLEATASTITCFEGVYDKETSQSALKSKMLAVLQRAILYMAPVVRKKQEFEEMTIGKRGVMSGFYTLPSELVIKAEGNPR